MASQYCRLCSESRDIMIPIFEKDGVRQNISDKINSRCQIFVNEADFLPKIICIVCCGKLCIYDEFVKKVQNTQTYLTKLLSGNNINYFQSEKENDVEEIKSEDDDSDGVTLIEELPEIIDVSPNVPCNRLRENRCISPEYIQLRKTKNTGMKSVEEVTLQHNSRSKRNVEPAGDSDCIEVSSSDENNFETDNKKRKLDEKFSQNQKSKRSKDEERTDKTDENNKKNMSTETEETQPARMTSKPKKVMKVRPVMKRKDFQGQEGNSLAADIEFLKNSLTKTSTVRSASVVTMLSPRNNMAGAFPDTHVDKGCQSEIVLGIRTPGQKHVTAIWKQEAAPANKAIVVDSGTISRPKA